ncbi:hypothetical protein [Embleya scabrispora]|uniref:hypothetical protein n=1 Tax=Embleya scabrispora TaxID=159449 RepID=UPI001319D442|nr:hypothetical protein [Embleya scabrispora]MYS86329.1 hypothetical protein [Streptomyces sp. SID5474]
MTHSLPPQGRGPGPAPQPWGGAAQPRPASGPAAPRKGLVIAVSVLITLASATAIVFLVLWLHNFGQSVGPVDRSDLKKDLPGPHNVGLGAPVIPGTSGGVA